MAARVPLSRRPLPKGASSPRPTKPTSGCKCSEDRNHSSHAYDQALAERIYRNIAKDYASLLGGWLPKSKTFLGLSHAARSPSPKRLGGASRHLAPVSFGAGGPRFGSRATGTARRASIWTWPFKRRRPPPAIGWTFGDAMENAALIYELDLVREERTLDPRLREKSNVRE